MSIDNPETEPTTDVYFVKTSDSTAGVIVSFTDGGEEDPVGIYLFEPGADPVELVSVGIDGVASEFEYATVTGVVFTEEREVNGDRMEKTFTFPGDGMVTRAQRDADVVAAVEEHDTLVDNHEKLRGQAATLMDAVRDAHEGGHSGGFQWCTLPMCEAARAVNL